MGQARRVDAPTCSSIFPKNECAAGGHHHECKVVDNRQNTPRLFCREGYSPGRDLAKPEITDHPLSQWLLPGDLLFYTDTTGLLAAVRATMGKYTHVAIVESVGDTIFIIDATQKAGVSRRPFTRSVHGTRPFPAVYRLTTAFDTAATLQRARALIGQPYDNYFLPHNGLIFCSELVYECYRDTDGNPLFTTVRISFRDAEGNVPPYWEDHFQKLGVPIPEGVLGATPTSLTLSPLLQRIR